MKRIGILTAGGDTPALNASIHGAVMRANQLKVEVVGLIKGFNSLFNPRVPHVHLNPLFREIPELDPTHGGTILGASRDYVDANDRKMLKKIITRLRKLNIDGLICVGGDGTLNGLQPLAEFIPTVLTPKTIDNDLGLNYLSEPDEWQRTENPADNSHTYHRRLSHVTMDLDYLINYVTPGYATSVFVSVGGIQRVRTTAESHRRIAIVEVMGRHSGYIALGAAYGQPDIILVPEHPLNLELLVERVKEIYSLQKNVVIVCGEGIVDEHGRELGAEKDTLDPAGNLMLTGAAEALRERLIERIEDDFFRSSRRGDFAKSVIFTRKIGHVQRGGRPLLFDRFYAAQLGGKAVDMLLAGQNNAISILQWNRERGFYLDSINANALRDRWGLIHARLMHPAFYNPTMMKPSTLGIEYLLPIFNNAIGHDDVEFIQRTSFNAGNLTQPFHSLNVDVGKRIRYLDN